MKKQDLLTVLPQIYDLITNYDLSISYICKEVGLERNSVARALKSEYGYESPFAAYSKKANKVDYDYIDAIAYERYLNGESITSIAKDFQIKRHSLSKRLKQKYELEVKNDSNKCTVNSDFFKQETDEKYYWLGYFWADGSLSSSTNNLELASKDLDIIEKFKHSLNSEHKISTKIIKGKKYYRICIKDDILYNDLLSLGIMPNKSNINSGYPYIPDEFTFSFLRGYIDGDGTYYKNKYNNITVSVCIGHANLEFAKWMQSLLIDHDITNVKLYNLKTEYRVTLIKKTEVKKLINYMYENSSVHMDRKYEKIKCLLSNCRSETNTTEVSE